MSNNSSTLVYSKIQGFIPFTPVLGQGYSSDKDMAAEFSCFNDGNVTLSGGGSSIVHFDSAVSFDDIQNSLNVDVSAKVGIGPFSGSASASYSRFIEDDSYSFSFYYYEQVFLPTKVWTPNNYGPELLNKFGSGVYNAGAETFRLVCGDKIFNQVDEGISLYATMKLHFQSHYQKSTFEANVGANYGDIVSVSATVKKMVSEYDLSGTVEMSAYQIGGNPSQLPKIFNKKGDDYYILSCSFAEFDDCKEAAAGILEYAQNNLSNQTQNGSAISWELVELEDLGINVGSTVITPQIKAARDELGSIYQNMTFASSIANHVVQSKYSSYIPDIELFQETAANISTNLAILQDPTTGVATCYTQPLNCTSAASQIESSLSFVNMTMLQDFENLKGYKVAESLDVKVCQPILGCNTHTFDASSYLIPLDFSNSFLNQDPLEKVSVVPNNHSVSVHWDGCDLVVAEQSTKLFEASLYDSSECINSLLLNYGCGESSKILSVSCTGAVSFEVIDNPI